MDEVVINDLKQFIAGTVKQHTAEIRADMAKVETRLEEKVSRLEVKLDQKIDDLSAAVAEALESNNEEHEKRLNNHKQRIARLEQKTQAI